MWFTKVYTEEITHKHYRNHSLLQVFWVLGTVSEVLLALWVMPTLGWRWLLGLSAIPVGIFVSFCFVSIFHKIKT